MRPSQYHYIKRMWTRNMYKQKGCCLTSLLLLPFKIIWLFSKPFLYIIGSVALLVCAVAFASIPLLLLGCVYLMFTLIKWIFKKVSVHTDIKESKHVQEQEDIIAPDNFEDFDASNDILIGMESMYLDWAKESAEIVNTTYSPLQFWSNLDEVISCLWKLSTREIECPNLFSVSPSKNLERVRKNLKQTQLDFINRSIKEDIFWTEISMVIERFDDECKNLIASYQNERYTKSFDSFSRNKYSNKTTKTEEEKQAFERFMIECNAYIEHGEQMEDYEKYYGIKDSGKE